ncbi:hypothetical protein ACSU64_27035 [Bacillaceae bacterium C204]|uniref:hypothetical protein n=1 Tax=Neobacillus sp. 204 TaxID=3383351 RepID=UPI00397D4641
MKKMTSLALAGILSVGLAVSSASAAVSVDATGTGFVGKGDVQLAYEWSNSALQKNASGLTFTYDTQDTYDVTEVWDTSAGKKTVHHDITVPKHVSVSASVGYDARTSKQITGFNLKGIDPLSVIIEGTVPVAGDPLTGNRHVIDPETGAWVEAIITDVQLTKSEGGLYAHYNGVDVAMPNTPVAPIVVPIQ